MRTSTVKAPRRRRHKKAARKKTAVARKRPVKRRRARRARKVHAVATRRRRKTVRVQATRARRRRAAPMMMEAKRKRRSPKRRRAVHAEAWKGNPAGHAKAARKGWRRKKARKAGKRRRSRRVSESTVAAPRRRRHSRRVHASVMEAPRHSKRRHSRRHRRGMFEAKRGGSRGMGGMELGAAVLMGGVGFVLADGLDRFLSTYNPAATGEKPKDKFTSDGAGTLANTLNIAAMPGWKRVVAGIGITAVPAVGAMYVKQPMVKASLEGAAIGAGISVFKTLWNSVLMPMLVGKDTSPAALQKSYIARLYPAEVAAHINLAAQKGADGKTAPGPYPAAGVLSDAPQTGVSAPAADVGPFALAGDSPYPNAEQALRREAGVHDQFPTVQNTWGTGGPGSDYPTAAQAMGTGDAPWQPGPPSSPGAGPQAKPHTDPACGCIGDPTIGFSGFIGDAPESDTPLFMQ